MLANTAYTSNGSGDMIQIVGLQPLSQFINTWSAAVQCLIGQ